MSVTRAALAALLLLCAGAAAAEDYQTLLTSKPNIGPRGRAGWDEYLQQPLHRAFAISPSGSWAYRTGSTSLGDAIEGAVANCQKGSRTRCELYAAESALARGGGIPPNPQPVRAGELASADGYFHAGPSRAKGAIVWSHGRAPGLKDSRGTPMPPFVVYFANAGWDVFRFDRDPRQDEVNWATAKLDEGARLLRRLGYARVVAAGGSRGAWHSLAALREPGVLDGVIAAAPAMHGTSDAGPKTRRGMADYRTLLERVADSRARIALFVFDDDEYDPDPPARAELAERAIGEKGNPRLVMRPAGISGHSAAGSRDFTLRYAPCLVRFIESVTPGPYACVD